LDIFLLVVLFLVTVVVFAFLKLLFFEYCNWYPFVWVLCFFHFTFNAFLDPLTEEREVFFGKILNFKVLLPE